MYLKQETIFRYTYVLMNNVFTATSVVVIKQKMEVSELGNRVFRHRMSLKMNDGRFSFSPSM